MVPKSKGALKKWWGTRKDSGANLRGIGFLITESDTGLGTNNYNNGVHYKIKYILIAINEYLNK